MGSLYPLWLPDAARETGYPVIEVPGWQTRGHGGFRVLEGVVGHHTGTAQTAKGDYPSLRVVRDGRAGLPGPLCNYGLARSGAIFVVAAGVAWHAGASAHAGFRDLNDEFLGIEAEHAGGILPWPDRQLDAYVKLVAAILRYLRRGTDRYVSHRGCALPAGRKPDPKHIDDSWMRARAAGTVGATVPPNNTILPRRKWENDVLDNQLIPAGKTQRRLIIPTGSASAMTARTFLSFVAAGDRGGSVRGWWQNDGGGISEFSTTIGHARGHSQRKYFEAPDGTTQVNLHLDFPDGGDLCIETMAK